MSAKACVVIVGPKTIRLGSYRREGYFPSRSLCSQIGQCGSSKPQQNCGHATAGWADTKIDDSVVTALHLSISIGRHVPTRA